MAINILTWISHNKMLLFFAFTTFFLFISTVALAQKSTELCARGPHSLQTCIKIKKQPSGFIQHVNDNDFVYGDNYYRLPKNVKPTHYDLHLSPSMTNKTFQGTVTITLRVLEQTKTIALHSNKLTTIKSIKLINVNHNKNKTIQSIELVADKRELLYVKFKNKIHEGYYKLSIQFEGRLDKGITGFYSSSLKNGGFLCVLKLSRFITDRGYANQ